MALLHANPKDAPRGCLATAPHPHHCLRYAGVSVGSGALGPNTRVSFRSQSAAFFLLLQVKHTEGGRCGLSVCVLPPATGFAERSEGRPGSASLQLQLQPILIPPMPPFFSGVDGAVGGARALGGALPGASDRLPPVTLRAVEGAGCAAQPLASPPSAQSLARSPSAHLPAIACARPLAQPLHRLHTLPPSPPPPGIGRLAQPLHRPLRALVCRRSTRCRVASARTARLHGGTEGWVRRRVTRRSR